MYRACIAVETYYLIEISDKIANWLPNCCEFFVNNTPLWLFYTNSVFWRGISEVFSIKLIKITQISEKIS